MKPMMRKLLTIFMALMMLCSSLPMGALAETVGAQGSVTQVSGSSSFASTIMNDVANDDFEIVNGVLMYYYGNGGDVVIPESVTSIGDDAFRDCENLLSVVIPESVTSIGASAFFNNVNLTTVVIPDSVTSIGYGAFSWCHNLTHVTLPKELTRIEDHTFGGCTALVDIDIPEGVTSIGKSAFVRCENLTSVVIPSSVKSIDTTAFGMCHNLVRVEMSEGLTSIGDNAFRFCEHLTYASIPESVTEIGDSAFEGCRLEQVQIPDGVTKIGNNAFGFCSFSSVIIPEHVKSIGDEAFNWCDQLTDVVIPASVTDIGDGAFSMCTGLTSILIPENVTYIGAKAFDGCDKLVATVVKGSYAEQYCIDNNIKYNLLENVPEVLAKIVYPTTLKMNVGETRTEKATSNKDTEFTYESSDPSVVEVTSKGKLTAKKVGTATILVTGKQSKAIASCEVTVSPVPTSIQIIKPKVTELNVGETLQLEYKLTPADAQTTVTWKSYPWSVAAINSKTGLIKGLSVGTANIWAITSNGIESETISIPVTKSNTPTGIKINVNSNVKLGLSKTLTLTATLIPETAVGRIEWLSSNDGIATVSNGVVRPRQEGTVTITARTLVYTPDAPSGRYLSASVEVTIYADGFRPSGSATKEEQNKQQLKFVKDAANRNVFTFKYVQQFLNSMTWVDGGNWFLDEFMDFAKFDIAGLITHFTGHDLNLISVYENEIRKLISSAYDWESSASDIKKDVDEIFKLLKKSVKSGNATLDELGKNAILDELKKKGELFDPRLSGFLNAFDKALPVVQILVDSGFDVDELLKTFATVYGTREYGIKVLDNLFTTEEYAVRPEFKTALENIKNQYASTDDISNLEETTNTLVEKVKSYLNTGKNFYKGYIDEGVRNKVDKELDKAVNDIAYELLGVKDDPSTDAFAEAVTYVLMNKVALDDRGTTFKDVNGAWEKFFVQLDILRVAEAHYTELFDRVHGDVVQYRHYRNIDPNGELMQLLNTAGGIASKAWITLHDTMLDMSRKNYIIVKRNPDSEYDFDTEVYLKRAEINKLPFYASN